MCIYNESICLLNSDDYLSVLSNVGHVFHAHSLSIGSDVLNVVLELPRADKDELELFLSLLLCLENDGSFACSANWVNLICWLGLREVVHLDRVNAQFVLVGILEAPDIAGRWDLLEGYS